MPMPGKPARVSVSPGLHMPMHATLAADRAIARGTTGSRTRHMRGSRGHGTRSTDRATRSTDPGG